MTKTTRRAVVLTGAASALALPAPAACAAPDDPIFAAIDTYQEEERAWFAYRAPDGEDIPDDVGDRFYTALETFLALTPCTVEGSAAYLLAVELAACRQDECATLFKSWTDEIAHPASTVLSRTAGALRGAIGAMPARNTSHIAPDPVLAALDRCRRIEEAAFAVDGEREDADAAYDVATEGMCEAREALALTVPTTLAGLAALVAFAAEMSERYGGMYFECEQDVMHGEGMNFLRSIDNALRALAVRS